MEDKNLDEIMAGIGFFIRNIKVEELKPLTPEEKKQEERRKMRKIYSQDIFFLEDE